MHNQYSLKENKHLFIFKVSEYLQKELFLRLINENILVIPLNPLPKIRRFQRI